MRLILASASARRRELLETAGIPFVVDAANVDERVHAGESPEAYAGRVAMAKADWGRARHASEVVLGADTIVVIDGAILGKPASDADAVSMLTRLSGRDHEVLTAVAFAWPTAQSRVHLERTRVWFTTMTPAEVDWYVKTGEPADKAGAYAIQGLGSRFVRRIDGSYSSVVGLPVATVLQFLREIGVNDDRP